LHRGEAGLQAELSGEDLRVPGDVRRAVVGQHLDDRRCAVCAEAALDGLEQEVANVRAANSGVGHGALGDDLAVMGVDDEGAADDVAVPSRVNSNPSEHQRRFERMTMTLPS